MPRVSILMPVYNAAPFLKEAIDSVLNQTFTDFEFIIVDDASTDETAEILENFKSDCRVKIVSHKDNKGLAVRLNEVLAIAQAPYIARMDGDDVADLKRFSKQVAFLDNHPDIGVCGTGFEVLPSGKKLRMPLKHKRIVERLLFTTGVCHPTVMMRREVLEKTGGYPVVPCAQDYALWVNLVSKGVKFANLQDNLLQYRVHKSSTTAQKKQKKRLVHAQVQGKVLEGLLKRKPTELELELHHKLSVREPDFGSIWQMFKWVLVLLQKGPFWLVLKNFVLWFIVSLRRRSA